MSFSSLLIHTVTIQNLVAGTTDRYGNETPVWDAGVTSKARVQQDERVTRTKEELIDRDTRETRFLVFLPASAPVTALSRFIWGTRTLNVYGEPVIRHDGVGNHHMEAGAIEHKG